MPDIRTENSDHLRQPPHPGAPVPAFYTQWLVERFRASDCLVPNPYYPEQVSRISLRLEDVDRRWGRSVTLMTTPWGKSPTWRAINWRRCPFTVAGRMSCSRKITALGKRFAHSRSRAVHGHETPQSWAVACRCSVRGLAGGACRWRETR
jgi:hypothetical protein